MTVASVCARLRALATLPVGLLVVFFLFYHTAAQQMKESPMYVRDDVFFRADTRRALTDMTGTREQSHIHSFGHPNFVILHAPIGSWLWERIKTRNRGMVKSEAVKQASITMTSAAGAGTVALFCGLLLAQGLTRLRAGLFASVLGCSAVQMFYASAPETYVFSALGITAVAFLACRRDLREPWWQLAAVYAWSALSSNIVLIGIWSLVRYWQRPFTSMVLKLVKVMSITLAVMVVIGLLQSVIYPKTMLFFMPSWVARESEWLYWDHLLHPIEHTRVLLQHQWLSNIIAPEPVARLAFGKVMMGSIEEGTWAMIAPSLPLLLLWSAFLVGAATSLRHRSFFQPPMLAALGTLAFNFAFFFVFGHDRMLYAALWTSTSVFVVASGVEALLQRQPKLANIATGALALLLVGEAWHNWHFLGKLAVLVQS